MSTSADRGSPSVVRERILDAARDVFRRNGPRTARMDDIAGAAGVARPNLYRYFPNREALVLEVLVAEIRAANDERRRVIPVIGPVRDLLVESLVMGAERARADEMFMSTLTGEGLDVTAQVIGKEPRILDAEFEYWAPLFAHGRARREIAPHLPDERIIRWFLNCHFFFANRPELFDGDLRDWIADFVVPPVLVPGAT